MTRTAWLSGLVAVLVGGLSAGCAAGTPNQAPQTGLTPAPMAPLRPGIPGQTPQPPLPASGKLLDLSVAGDPTRVHYPEASLTPGEKYPVLIFFHGHGMDRTQVTSRTRFAAIGAREGWLVAAGDLGGRGHWGNDGALRATGALVAELVARHQADPRRIYMVGFSMGGGTAMLAAANPLGLPYRAAAVVSSQGFSDLAAMTEAEAGGGAYARSIGEAYGGTLTPEAAKAHSPVSQAERLRGVPVYMEHGEADTAVPASHTREMAERLRRLGIPFEVQLMPGKGHGEESIDEERITAFLRGKAAP